MTSRSLPYPDRRWWRRGAPMLGALFACLAPARVLAQPSEPLELRWEAPAGCPSERHVLARISKLAGSAGSSDATVRAEAKVSHGDDGRFHLELVIRAGDLIGARSFDGSSCEDLAGATAVALALLLRSSAPLSEDALAGRDASASSPGGSTGTKDTKEESSAAQESESSESSEKKSGPSAEPSPTPEPDEVRADGAHGERAPTHRAHGLLRAPVGAVALGPLPQPSFGLAASAGLAFERLRVLVEGSAFRSQVMTATDEPGTGAAVQRMAAGLEACWALLPGRFEVAPCLAFDLEHLRARGTGDHVAPRTGSITFPAAGVGLHARWQLLTWFGLFGGVRGVIEASRPRLAIDGVGTLGQMSAASLTVTLGPEWIL